MSKKSSLSTSYLNIYNQMSLEACDVTQLRFGSFKGIFLCGPMMWKLLRDFPKDSNAHADPEIQWVLFLPPQWMQ